MVDSTSLGVQASLGGHPLPLRLAFLIELALENITIIVGKATNAVENIIDGGRGRHDRELYHTSIIPGSSSIDLSVPRNRAESAPSTTR